MITSIIFTKDEENGAFLHGALHWVANQNPEPCEDFFIVAFDLKSELDHVFC